MPECSFLQLSYGTVEYRNLSLVGEGTYIISEGANTVYNCNPGFLVVGDKVRHCLNTGLWSLESPTCKGILLILILSIYDLLFDSEIIFIQQKQYMDDFKSNWLIVSDLLMCNWMLLEDFILL